MALPRTQRANLVRDRSLFSRCSVDVQSLINAAYNAAYNALGDCLPILSVSACWQATLSGAGA